MPIRFEAGCAVLEGQCVVEEAHDLTAWLLEKGARTVDLAHCTGLHTAVLQSLMALQPAVVVGPADADLARWLAPLIPPVVPAKAAAPRRRRKRGAAKQAA